MPPDPRGHPAYSDISTFLHLPWVNQPIAIRAAKPDVAIVGAPFDVAVTHRPGARFGPRAIRAASNLTIGAFHHLGLRIEPFNYLTGIDAGDALCPPGDIQLGHDGIREKLSELLTAAPQCLPIVLGGDHSITYPIVRAFSGPIHVVQFDAHLDYLEPDGDYRYTNEHAFRQIGGLDSVNRLTAVGIRSLRTSARLYRDAVADGNRIVPPHELRELGSHGVAELVPADARCYVTIDIDSLDHSLVPGCVSAEPGGLTYDELRGALVALAERVEIVGLDLVEVNPMVDIGAGATAYLAAHLLVETLGAICRQPRWSAARAPATN
jgi:agmatinase